MLGSKWNRWLLVSGLAVGALAACGEEDDGNDGTQTPINTVPEAGTTPGTNTTPEAGTVCTAGAVCTLPSGGSGRQTCNGGVAGCVDPSAILGGLLDSGILADGGLGNLLADSGFGFPEAAVSALADSGLAKACPSGFTCADPAAALGQMTGLKVCNKPGAVYGLLDGPPECTTPMMACTTDGLNGICQNIPILGNRCAQVCQ